jgi:uncharacterized oxidoreductase
MKTSGNTILITGGATGIGLSLAESFLKAGNEVIICGRRENKLEEAKEKFPELHTRVCDVSKAAERVSLFEWATGNFPKLNVLINNAGIQREVRFASGGESFHPEEHEVETNFTAPIHLTALFTSHLMQQPAAAIMNVTSGLAFIPIAVMPVYCATKAALHSFTWSLRHQLKNTSVKVFEIVPPIVDTDLDKGARDRRGQTDKGIQPEEVAEATMKAFANDELDCLVAGAGGLLNASRNNPQPVFERMNSH